MEKRDLIPKEIEARDLSQKWLQKVLTGSFLKTQTTAIGTTLKCCSQQPRNIFQETLILLCSQEFSRNSNPPLLLCPKETTILSQVKLSIPNRC